MRLLLDTHVLLWTLALPERLSQRARVYLEDPANSLSASLVSMWEIAIKRSVHPESVPIPSGDIPGLCAKAGISLLSVRPQHIGQVETLPMWHRDPFDRLLIAQALTEPMYLVTHDDVLASYGGTIIVV